MDGNGKPGREATEPTTLLLMVCTRCLGLRKEPLGRATTVCGCGGQRRILRVVHDEPEAAAPPPRPRPGGSRGGANGAGGGANGAGPGGRGAPRSSNGRLKRGTNGGS